MLRTLSKAALYKKTAGSAIRVYPLCLNHWFSRLRVAVFSLAAPIQWL